MDLDIQQPTQSKSDKVCENINEIKHPPLHMQLIPSLLKLTKQSWTKPSSILQMSQRVKNLYKTHGTNTNFLSKYPLPNSVIVDVAQTHSRNHLNVTLNNKEGRKLDIIGHRVYSLASFTLRAANYLAAMGAYYRFLWNKGLGEIQT